VRNAAVVGVSVIAHVAALGWLARTYLRRPRRPAPVEPPLERADPPPERADPPLEITVLAPEQTAVPARGAAAAPGARAWIRQTAPAEPIRDGLAVAAPRSSGPAASAPSDHAPPGPGGDLLRMRRPDLLPDTVLAPIAAAGTRAPTAPPPRSGRLEDAPGGRGVIHDAVATIDVARDGTVHIRDAPDLSAHLQLPSPADAHDELRAWLADPWAITHQGPTSDLPETVLATPGVCDQWGNSMCDGVIHVHEENGAIIVPVLGGTADVTAALMRAFHAGDPYAARKQALLDATFAERVARGGAFRAEQQARSAELMERNLERLWTTTRDPAARRRALFELWDECADDAAGARARAMVIGWIRAHLPAGSPDAYSPAELDALSARRTSRQPFAPY
jgi:hypothetical protein